MAEIVVSAVITVLCEKLISGDLLKLARSKGVDSQVQKLKDDLPLIQAVLADATQKHITNKAVQLWVNKLQELAYDIDDALDDLATEAIRRKLKQEARASTGNITGKRADCTLKFAQRVSGVELGAARSNKDARGVHDLMDQVSSLRDTLGKKDEEMVRLRGGTTNGRAPCGGGLEVSETGSERSGDELEDIEMLGLLGEDDLEERLSDISYGGLSMTDGSLGIVELTLFPRTVKPPEKLNMPAKLPRPPQKTATAAAATSSRKPVHTTPSSSSSFINSQRVPTPSRTSLAKAVPRVSLGSSGKKSTHGGTSVKPGVRR